MSGDIEASSPSKEELSTPASRALTCSSPNWTELGEGFETMGKIGLALAVGFSAAGLFCRLADQGKIRLPGLVNLLIKSSLEREQRPAQSGQKKP